MSKPALRVIDSGVRDGRLHIAYGQALVDGHEEGSTPDTLRFLRFPPTALVGRHQGLSREINLDYCEKNGIGTARRITGGGAIYLDEGQLGWELVVHKSRLGTARLDEVTHKICTAAAEGLSLLGLDVVFRPRNDLEVDGRKVSGTGGFFDGDTLFFQGTVLVDMKPDVMIGALNIPAAKLAKKNLKSAADRVTTLNALMGDDVPALAAIQKALVQGMCEGLGFEPEYQPGFTAAEDAAARAIYTEEIGLDDFVYEIDDPESDRDVWTGSVTGRGGTISAHVRFEGALGDRIREIVFTGDFFATPPRLIYDLEAQLRGEFMRDVEKALWAFFDKAQVEILTASPDEFLAALEAAYDSKETS